MQGTGKSYEVSGNTTEWDDILIKKGIRTKEEILLEKGLNPEDVSDELWRAGGLSGPLLSALQSDPFHVYFPLSSLRRRRQRRQCTSAPRRPSMSLTWMNWTNWM
jgi:hypothetical protein